MRRSWLFAEKDLLNGGSQRILHYLQRDTGMRHFMDGHDRDGDYDDKDDESGKRKEVVSLNGEWI